MSRGRDTRIGRDVRAGCFQCHGHDAHWLAPNAQGVAARHHDATGHETWVEVHMTVRYGAPAAPQSMPLPFEEAGPIAKA